MTKQEGQPTRIRGNRIESERKRPPILALFSNRLPKKIEHGVVKDADGGLTVVTKPVLHQKSIEGFDVRWYGWAGTYDHTGVQDAFDKYSSQDSAYTGQKGYIKYCPIVFNLKEHNMMYKIASETLWSLAHEPINPRREDLKKSNLNNLKYYFDYYVTTGDTAAMEMNKEVGGFQSGDMLRVDDFHAYTVGRSLDKVLKSKGVNVSKSFQHHIPWYEPENFKLLGAAGVDILEAMTHYDLVSLQRKGDVDKFINCLVNYLPGVNIDINREGMFVKYQGRRTKLVNHLVGVDIDDIKRQATGHKVERASEIFIRENKDKRTGINLSRMDHTKRIEKTLIAYDRAFELDPALTDMRHTLHLAASESREGLPAIRKLRSIVEMEVERVNKRGSGNWKPVVYHSKGLHDARKWGYFKEADDTLIFPYDGRNVVYDERIIVGKLTQAIGMSRTAGSADLYSDKSVIKVTDPDDIEEVAHAIVRVATMPDNERLDRMKRARAELKEYTVFDYSDAFFNDWNSMRQQK